MLAVMRLQWIQHAPLTFPNQALYRLVYAQDTDILRVLNGGKGGVSMPRRMSVREAGRGPSALPKED